MDRISYIVKHQCSCIQFQRLCLDSWWKYKRQFKLQYPIHEKLLLKIIPARMKGIRRDILPNTNTGNQKVASAMKIQKCKMLRGKPKNVRPQRQKLAQYLQIWPFQSNLNGNNFWTTRSFGPPIFWTQKIFHQKFLVGVSLGLWTFIRFVHVLVIKFLCLSISPKEWMFLHQIFSF